MPALGLLLYTNISWSEVIMPKVSFDALIDQLLVTEMRYMHAVRLAERDQMAKGSLSVPQYWALLYIGGHGPCPMNEICEAMNLKCSSASGLVDRLSKLGMVKRARDPKDRRSVLVSVTAKGSKAVQHSREEKRQMIAKMFEPLSDKERMQYLSLVEKIASGLPQI